MNISTDSLKTQTCYTTLAIGHKYNAHALQLSKDIYEFSPNTPFVVLTDKPHLFRNQRQVIAIKHVPKSVGIFHDKLYCFEFCLKHYDCCIFLDADCRLMDDFTSYRKWKAGLTVNHSGAISKNINSKSQKVYDLASDICKVYGLSIEDCKSPYEAILVLCRDNGKEYKFLESWKILRDWFEINYIYDSERTSIAIAACKNNLSIYSYKQKLDYPDEYDGSDNPIIYKDKLFYQLLCHQNKKALSQEIIDKVLSFDQERRKIENSSILEKINLRIIQPAFKKLRLIQLNFRYGSSSKNFEDFLDTYYKGNDCSIGMRIE